ncbi:MAG: Tetratricopeptide TPR_2 repeat protein [Candidatus Woesebacteria bacterium GW2011_GWB1_45_5]|uniref:Tetratricopeptide TPR_2 repeat protein n=1 Tax=Candidatus Woesebacteria bacterium GW2011_GWB1_45_5 TaxID=1618581 RepID=A0A0G1QL77_9BACT|nr:MAG: Tetratricopeptide TPR_2 repeat protein [Candidatus Woesebacteria bacterium GW2011_GWB1_45_5]
METTLAQKAISLALSGQWEEATKINLDLLKESPDDTDALNRLARAYAELGKISEAKKIASKVLNIDPGNSIAQRCLEKWKTAKKTKGNGAVPASVDSFLEEPGKTKLVPLVNMGDSGLFASLDPGEEVKLFASAHKVSVVTNEGKYLGRFSDDLASRLGSLMKSGYKYKVVIKSLEAKEVVVFIREINRGKNGSDVSSFPQEKIDYVSFTPPELVHKEQPEALDGLEENPEEI